MMLRTYLFNITVHRRYHNFIHNFISFNFYKELIQSKFYKSMYTFKIVYAKYHSLSISIKWLLSKLATYFETLISINIYVRLDFSRYQQRTIRFCFNCMVERRVFRMLFRLYCSSVLSVNLRQQ